MDHVAPSTKSPWLKPYSWKPGQSGNPKGLKVSLTNRIRELTGGGVEMVDVMVGIMRGHKIKGVRGYLSYSHILEATKWLSEQVFGKAPFTITDSQGGTYELQKLLYMELKKYGNESGVFDVSETALLGQDLETQQPVQDPIKNGCSEVQIKPVAGESLGRLPGNETDPAHHPQE